MIHRLRLLALPILALIGCGSISDPSKTGERVSTVTGALTGTGIPANARVALVWKQGTSDALSVGADVPVINGKFSMALAEPPDSYFFDTEANSVSSTTSAPPPDLATAPPTPPTTATKSLRPLDTVSGGITGNLNAALGGFVVYEDTNGNGKLDIDASGATTDTVIGGNKDLMIVDLRGGGALDLEKLRDKSGILPEVGLNLFFSENRWVGLNLVELKLNSFSRLPSGVCGSGSIAYSDSSGGSAGSAGSAGGGAPVQPICSADGRSYTYPSDCTPPVPPAPTLCNGNGEELPYACAKGPTSTLPPGEPVPAGWPCTVSDGDGGIDGGPAPDASVDGGPAPDAGK